MYFSIKKKRIAEKTLSLWQSITKRQGGININLIHYSNKYLLISLQIIY